MIIELGLIILWELIVLLMILIVYCADYTNSYIHAHTSTKPIKYIQRDNTSSHDFEGEESDD